MNLDFRSEQLVAGAHEFEMAHHNGHVCAGCRYAQVFAVQPRAVCTRAGADQAGQILGAGQPACGRYAERPADDLELAEFLAAALAAAHGPVTHFHLAA